MDKRAHSQMRRISLCGAIRIVTCHCSRYVQVRLVRFRCVRACWCVRMRCVCVYACWLRQYLCVYACTAQSMYCMSGCAQLSCSFMCIKTQTIVNMRNAHVTNVYNTTSVRKRATNKDSRETAAFFLHKCFVSSSANSRLPYLYQQFYLPSNIFMCIFSTFCVHMFKASVIVL